jgi:hypothetical protein
MTDAADYHDKYETEDITQVLKIEINMIMSRMHIEDFKSGYLLFQVRNSGHAPIFSASQHSAFDDPAQAPDTEASTPKYLGVSDFSIISSELAITILPITCCGRVSCIGCNPHSGDPHWSPKRNISRDMDLSRGLPQASA